MFLIGAFIIAVSLIIIKITMKTPNIEEELMLLDVTMENEVINNMRQELENSAKFSIDIKENITTNVFDFAKFIKNKSAEHALEFKFIFLGVLTNISSGHLNVSVINMMREPMHVILNLTNDTRVDSKSENILDATVWNTDFEFATGESYNLTLSYYLLHTGSVYTENITIKTKKNKDIYVGFFDTTFQTVSAVYRNKIQNTYNLK